MKILKTTALMAIALIALLCLQGCKDAKEELKIEKCEKAVAIATLDPWDDRLRECIFLPEK